MPRSREKKKKSTKISHSPFLNPVVLPRPRPQHIDPQTHPPRRPLLHITRPLHIRHLPLTQHTLRTHKPKVEIKPRLKVTLRTGCLGEENTALERGTRRQDEDRRGARTPGRRPHTSRGEDEFVWEVVWGRGRGRRRVNDDGDAAGVAGVAGVGEGGRAGGGAVGGAGWEEEVFGGDGPAGGEGLRRGAHDGGPMVEGGGDRVADSDVLGCEFLLAGFDEGEDAGFDPGVEAGHCGCCVGVVRWNGNGCVCLFVYLSGK